jgi:hypothetical protein
MKFFYCTCNISVTERITELLDANKISGYQVIDRVLAKPFRGNPRLDTSVWPGVNAVILIQTVSDEQSEKVHSLLAGFNSSSAENENELITVCSWRTDNIIFE